MDSNAAKQQVVDRLKQASNVLVTVRSNPSVDQLAACIGLTLMLNKLGKHGTAVFSGQVPSTIEFLKPEATLEKNTDSLRDFIIALDKSKADKLRYKVEDKVVKIFITPYKTSISDKDLEFSQGDFNVDVVIALGVRQQQDLDQAITSHGRILHDATVISVNNTNQASNLGNLNWIDPSASSLSELVVLLDGQLGKSVLDAQISTALLTGIVAETDRFSNNKTTSQTMTISAKLMSAGANQQLVATKLEQPTPAPPKPVPPVAKPSTPKNPTTRPTTVAQTKPASDGTIKIDHDDKSSGIDLNAGSEESEEAQIHIDDEGMLHHANELPPAADLLTVTGGTPIMTKPPTWDNKLTANSQPDSFDQGREPSSDPLSLPSVEPPLLNRPEQSVGDQPPAGPGLQPSPPYLDEARDAVAAAAASSHEQLKPRIDLNAQPVFDSLNPNPAMPALDPGIPVQPPAIGPAHAGNISNPAPPVPGETMNMPKPQAQSGLPENPGQSGFDEDTPSGAPSNPNDPNNGNVPPPVPPPMTPVF